MRVVGSHVAQSLNKSGWTIPSSGSLQRFHDGIAVHEFRARSVHQIGASFHLRDHLRVDHIFRLWMKRAIERDHVTDLEQAFDVLMECDVQFLFSIGW
jgi:hypothetical protein